MINAPDFSMEDWHCDACDEGFPVEVGSYDLNDGGWIKCPACSSERTRML
jgi:hypothetical protein